MQCGLERALMYNVFAYLATALKAGCALLERDISSAGYVQHGKPSSNSG